MIRQFWPWFLFGLPALTVVAGLVTWWIAAHNADYLVADDYYRDGLAINRELSKQRLAAALGVRAELQVSPPILRLRLEGQSQPPALRLHLSHPLDARQDTTLTLARTSRGIYETLWPDTNSKRWLWRVEPLAVSEGEHWRVDGEIIVP